MKSACGVAAQNHHLISPTAKIMAFLRSFSGIQNARRISEDVDGEATARHLYQKNFEKLVAFGALWAEARYRCFDRFVDGYRNFLEIAVGTSIERGHRIAIGASLSTYVGTDLPGMIMESDSLYRKYYIPQENHHLVPGNVLSREQLDGAADLLGPEETMVLHEGLWMYLSPQEQLEAGSNIRRILERAGGVWVTPDFDDQEHTQSALDTLPADLGDAINQVNLAGAELTQRDLVTFLPKDSTELHRFFKQVGLRADEHRMVEDDMKLTSGETFWGSDPCPYREFLKSMRLWTVYPARSRQRARGYRPVSPVARELPIQPCTGD